ncbi:hypothetical protein FACS1894166_13660 [Bacilli bacterium]|nr:hypothetical protein FACS1894166_13660 [Bacilli bacterium]
MFSLVALIAIFLTIYYKKIRQKKDNMVPLLVATISLIIGETVKQILGATVHPYNTDVLPLSICASCLI